MCFNVADEARRVERMDPEDVKDEIEDMLKRTFKNKIKQYKT